MDEYLKLSEVSRRTSISRRTLKAHRDAIGYVQPTPRLILFRWSNVVTWLERSRADAARDPYVAAIVNRLAEAGVR